MTLYKRNGIWHYDFTLNGQRYFGTTKERQEGRARTFESKIRTEAAEKRLPPGLKKVPSLCDFTITFINSLELATAAGHKAKNTLRDYKYGKSLLESTALWNMRLDRIDSTEVEKVRFPSWAMGNSALRTLRRILHQAEEQRLIFRAPKIKLFEDRQRTTVIEPWLEEIMLAEAKEPLRTVMIIMLDSFLRPFEVVAIRWEDIRWERKEIWVPDSKSPTGRRFVGLTERMSGALTERKRLTKSPWVFPAKRLVGPAPLGHMWATSLGKMWGVMKKRTIAKVWETNPKWQWPSDLVLYSSRHTGATAYSDAVGQNQFKVKQALGHSDLKTSGRYIHHAQDQGKIMDGVVEDRKVLTMKRRRA